MSALSREAHFRRQSTENVRSVTSDRRPYLNYVRDLIGVICLAMLSLAAGFIINRFDP